MTSDKNNPSELRADIDAGDSADEGGVVDVGFESKSGTEDHSEDIPKQLPLLPIRDTVAFPGTVMPLQIIREKSKRVLDMALAGSRMIAVVAQRSAETEDPRLDDLYRVGTACIILKMLKMADGNDTIIVHGLERVGIESITERKDFLEATVHAHADPKDASMEQKALMHTIRTAADRVLELSPNVPDEAREVLNNIESPGGLGDFLSANLPLSVVRKQELLETFDVTDRLRKVNLAVANQLDVLELSNKIQKKVKSQVDEAQREYYLREQLKAIRKELGEQEGVSPTLDRLRERIQAANMPEATETDANREVDRMEHIPLSSPEYGMALDYVEWLVDLPWSVTTEDNLDLPRAEQILDEDHHGLKKVKTRILEFLAVRTLKPDTRGPILCFSGPPGVGKTSLGQSIARAMGRKFIRISLGGIRDEATIRGHRRTYIGAMPGRIIREIKRAGSNNPLFMLDEVDKIGQDVRGDPMSALLEVLDPAQNATFSDHYLGVPFDLSKVLFIATANYMAAIEPALRDRMEVIELSGYTRREKLIIARKHLLPRQLLQNGLTTDHLELDDECLSLIISNYTGEAGVRSLERKIGGVCRARAASIVRKESTSPAVTVDQVRKILGRREYESEVASTRLVPGVVTGLAFTPVGGEILFVEATKMPGSGQLNLTGQLGDVMRESAWAAASIIRGHFSSWTVKRGSYRSYDYHVHVPAGAVPKDGPSAGVAMLCAMTSALIEYAIDPTIGMTGEITLSGRVLPVGGIREKILAAHRAGLKTVVLPARNEADLEEIPEDIRDQIKFVFVDSISELVDFVFAGVDKTSRKPRQAKKASAERERKVKKHRKGAGRTSKAPTHTTPRGEKANAPKRRKVKTPKGRTVNRPKN